MDVQHAREQMIEQQIRAWEVLDPRVLLVMSEILREEFVPAEHRQLAYADMMIPLPGGQFMLTPNIDGRMLQALMVQPGEQALDVGTGSGYSAACLAGLGARVHSIELDPELMQQATDTHTRLGLTNIQVENADASQLDVSEKYDVIAVTGSVPQYEKRFASALRPGGRLFLTVGKGPAMEALLVTRTGPDAWLTESLFETTIPALKHFDQPPQFNF